MTFTLTPLSHYNSTTEPHARFLFSLMKDLTIDFLSHFITSINDAYQDTATRNKLIFPSTITRTLQHFSIPIPLSPLFTFMGAISAGSIQQSKAQLQLKRPRVEMTDPAAPIALPFLASSFSAPSTSKAGGVTLEAIMEQLQRMQADFGGHLDYLTDEMCQMNTRVGRIACQQACMASFSPSSSPEHPAASPSEDDNDDDEDDEDGASSSGDDEMTTSQ